MRNRDLICFLKPISNQFSAPGSVEFMDVTGQVTDIQADPARLTIRLNLSAGLYSGRFETAPHAFDMSTAMIELWSGFPMASACRLGHGTLDHIHRNVMALLLYAPGSTGKLKGGLWFAVPGPDQIARGSLCADFGFEAQDG